MEGIKYVNLIEIGPVVIEIRGAENGELAVPVNNTLVRHTAFLAADTRPCVLTWVLMKVFKIQCSQIMAKITVMVIMQIVKINVGG